MTELRKNSPRQCGHANAGRDNQESITPIAANEAATAIAICSAPGGDSEPTTVGTSTETNTIEAICANARRRLSTAHAAMYGSGGLGPATRYGRSLTSFIVACGSTVGRPTKHDMTTIPSDTEALAATQPSSRVLRERDALLDPTEALQTRSNELIAEARYARSRAYLAEAELATLQANSNPTTEKSS